MIRITELRLPIDHPSEAVELAILQRLKLKPADLIRTEVFKRSYDARKNVKLAFIYTVDIAVKDEVQVLKACAQDVHIRPAPDTSYHFVAQAASLK